MRKSVLAVAAALALAAMPSLNPATAADLRVPKTAWPLCDTSRVTYCIESVSILPLGTAAPIPLTWASSGVAAPTAAVDTATASTDTATASSGSMVEKAPAGTAAKPGRWTSATWSSLGFSYDGIFVSAKTANEFTNHVMVDVQPIVADSANKTFLAVQAAGSVYATSLNLDTSIIVKLRTGEIKTGVTVGIGQNVSVNSEAAAGGSVITIQGEPVTVPIAARTADCSGETGKAVARVAQMQAIIVVQNDNAGFGVDGVSGDMYVASNGVCALSTPVWNNETKEMTWQVGAPHFAEDGTTVNRGFYNAVIPADDAKLLWGLENPNDAATALQVSVSTEEGGSTAALFNISTKTNSAGKKVIIIDASGFTYSKPKLKIKKNPAYKPTKAATAKKAASVTCVKGKSTKSFKGTKCPSGWKKK